MIASGYVQILPIRTRAGSVSRLRLDHLTQGMPASPQPGALVVKVSIEVDPEVFKVPELRLELDADPSQLQAVLVPTPVQSDDIDDIQGDDA